MQGTLARTGRGLEIGLLMGTAAALAALLLVRLDIVRSAGGLGFFVALVVTWCSNLFWWSWVLRSIVTGLSHTSPTGRWRLLLGIAWTSYCLTMSLPFFLFMVGGRAGWDALPSPLLAWMLIWHVLLAGLGCVAVVVVPLRSLSGWARRRWAPARVRRPTTPSAGTPHCPAAMESANETQAVDPPQLSRRGLLAGGVAAAPLVITGAGTLAGGRQQGRFLTREITIKAPRLPEGLRGLTITHVSDMHVGRFFRPEHLPRMVDAANKFGSHILAVTGDLIDHSNDVLPAIQQAIEQIEAPGGRYLVIGNHDLLDDPEALVAYLAAHQPHFLRDERVSLNVGGEQIQIAGLHWSRHEAAVRRDVGLAGRAKKALDGQDPDRFTIALVHHPHAFEALAEQGADLVLAGHTRGGQIMLTPSGMRPPVGAGNLLFRYIHGVYEIGRCRMYVNSGVGNWFPVRINAPAEIVKITLA